MFENRRSANRIVGIIAFAGSFYNLMLGLIYASRFIVPLLKKRDGIRLAVSAHHNLCLGLISRIYGAFAEKKSTESHGDRLVFYTQAGNILTGFAARPSELWLLTSLCRSLCI